MDKNTSTFAKTDKDEINRNPVLIAQQGPLEGQRWNILAELTIGRAQECNILIPDRQVSRFHARIIPNRKTIDLEDLGSKNGTFVGRKPLEGRITLQDGMTFQVALVQKFVYFISDATLPLEDIPFLDSKNRSGIFLDKKSRRVWVGSNEIIPPLSVPQFALLELLYTQPGLVVSKDEMVATVWSDDISDGVSDQALDALIRRLRERLTKLDPDFQYIVTVRGHGLRLQNKQEK